ncbi:MAG: multicopper oxidase domain-containing protein [Gemmatimonadaceae bacterium]
MRLLSISTAIAASIALSIPATRPVTTVRPTNELLVATANDNRASAGTLDNGVLTIALDATLASWKPDLNVDTMATVQAFAERGRVPSIPGPLIRVRLGTEIRASIRNTLADSTLIVHGLRSGTRETDTIQIPSGQSRDVVFKPAEAGTYLYWGTTSHSKISGRWGREAQLNGAIVIDPPGQTIRDRVFVISLIDIYPDSIYNPAKEDVWEVAINGRSWPHTERLNHQVGDTIRWRFINATDRYHPMHLHGFHFRTLAKGDWTRDTTYKSSEVQYAVTEVMLPGSTAYLSWVPTRAGNWLFHCHMAPHITPYPERPDSVRLHDAHDLMRHPEQAMAGLVLGVIVTDPHPKPVSLAARYRERIFAQETIADSPKSIARGFVLQRGAIPRKDSIEVPGTPLILHRGERTAVTVVNRMSVPTSVHWHGMELESLYDGVSGWSGVGASRSPMVMPGDSFAVAFTPPRAGTFIYHTHMDEEAQLTRGMYAPMIVLEPGEVYDPKRDFVFMFGMAIVGGKEEGVLNGTKMHAPLELVVGKTYRFRFVNILPAARVQFSMVKDSLPIIWRSIAKDGASLPAARVKNQPAVLPVGVGETYDFEWTPSEAMDAVLQVRPLGPEPIKVDKLVHVRAGRASRE